MPDSRSLLALAALAFLVSCTPSRPTDETPTGQVETPAPSVTAAPTTTPTAAPTVEISPMPTPSATPRPFELITLPSSYEGPLPDGALAQFGYGNLNAVSVSPQGTYVALGTSSSVVLFRTDTLERVWTLPVTTYINRFAWTDDESRLAVGGLYGDSVVLDIAAGEQLFTFSPQDHWLEHLTWTPDARLLVGATRDGYVMVWDGSSGVLLRQMHFDETPPSDYNPDVRYTVFSLSPDGRYAAAAYLYPETGSCCIPGDNVVIWDVNSGAQLHRLAIDDQSDYLYGAADLAWSPDGSTLAVVGNGIQFWDAESGQQQGESIPIWASGSIHWSPDGTKLVVIQFSDSRMVDTITRQVLFEFDVADRAEFLGWSADSTQFAIQDLRNDSVVIRDSTTGEMQSAPSAAGGSSAFTPDFRRFFMLTRDICRSLVEWNAETQTSTTVLTGTAWMRRGAALSPDGSQIAIPVEQPQVTLSYQVLIWDIAADRAIATLGGGRHYFSVRWSPDGSMLAVNTGYYIVLYDISNWEHITRIPLGAMDSDTIPSFDWSPDSAQIVLSEDTIVEDVLAVINVSDGEEIFRSEQEERGTVRWSPDGDRVAFFDDDGRFEMLDSRSGEVLETWVLPDEGFFWHASINPDLTLLAIQKGSIDEYPICSEVQVRSTETGDLLHTFSVSEVCEYDVVWSPWLPDSSALALRLEGGAPPAIYDPRTGARLAALPAAPVDFSADGQLFASISYNTVVLWAMPD